jgi:hypothetical protein
MDWNNIVVQTEYAQRRAKEAVYVPDTNAWYAMAGYRIGKVLPYYSHASYSDAGHSVSLPAAFPKTGVLALTVNGVLASAEQTSDLIGVRWDFAKSMALKVQVDRIKPGAKSGALIFAPAAGVKNNVTVVAPRSTSYSDKEGAMKYLITAALLAAASMLPPRRKQWSSSAQKNPATRMFSEQAAQFFLGKSTMFTPVDQADGSAIRNEFYKKVTDKDAGPGKGHLVETGVYRQGAGAEGIQDQRRGEEGRGGRSQGNRVYRQIGS